ncbi:MAG: SET domain-containing protein [Xanthobacteraceae bacterium]
MQARPSGLAGGPGHNAARAISPSLVKKTLTPFRLLLTSYKFATIPRTMSSRFFRIGRSVTGLGLFATKPIKRGVYIVTYRGRRITTEEADRLEARGAKYQFEINKRWTIDGSPRWNVARYINHSCRPNAKPVGRRGGIVIVALRRIEPGEEITYDYGRQYREYFLENGGCRCAACRRKRALRRRRNRRVTASDTKRTSRSCRNVRFTPESGRG